MIITHQDLNCIYVNNLYLLFPGHIVKNLNIHCILQMLQLVIRDLHMIHYHEKSYWNQKKHYYEIKPL